MSEWSDIENKEAGGSVRDKINQAMYYLFNNILSFWEEDGDNIKPSDDKGVNATEVNAGELNATEATIDDLTVDELTHTEYTGHTGIKPAGFDSDGKLVTWEEQEAGGVQQQGRGVQVVTSDVNLDALFPNIIAYADSQHIDVNLPVVASANGTEVCVRLGSTTGGNAVTVKAVSLEPLLYNNQGTPPASGQITTNVLGAWIVLRSWNNAWYVTQDSGDWTYVT